MFIGTAELDEYEFKGDALFKEGLYDESLKYFLKLTKVTDKLNNFDLEYYVCIYEPIVQIYKTRGDFEKVLYYSLILKKIYFYRYKQYSNKEWAIYDLLLIYFNISTLYKLLNNSRKSLQYIKCINILLNKPFMSSILSLFHIVYPFNYFLLSEMSRDNNDFSHADKYANIANTFLENMRNEEMILEEKDSLESIMKTISLCELSLSKIYNKDIELTIKLYIQAFDNFEFYSSNSLNISSCWIYSEDKTIKSEGDLITSQFDRISFNDDRTWRYQRDLREIQSQDLISKRYLPDTTFIHDLFSTLASAYYRFHYKLPIPNYTFLLYNSLMNLLIVKDNLESYYKDDTTHIKLAICYNNLSVLYKELANYRISYIYANKAYEIYFHYRKSIFSYSDINEKKEHNIDYKEYFINLIETSFQYAKSQDDNTYIKQNILNKWLQYKGSISDFENIITILYNETKDESIKELIVKREDLRKQLSYLYHSKEEDPKKQEIQRERSTQIEKEITQIENTLSQSFTALSEEAKLEKIDVEMLVSNINNTEAYLDYAYVGGIYYLFSVNGENIGFLSLDKELSDEINNTISTYTNEVARCTTDGYMTTPEDKATTRKLLAKLYELIIKPYEETIFNDKYHNYIISPDGPLGLIPFDALYDGEKYLVETKNITYAPSGKELVRIRRNQSNESKKIVVFANPDFNSDIPMPVEEKEEKNNEDDLLMGEDINRSFRTLSELCHLGDKPFEPLSGTLAELQSVKDAATEEDFIAFDKSQATKENFLKVTNTKILHCATHAFYLNCPDTENPLLKTGIAFAGANIIQEDGSRPHVATGLELASMKLQGTELVVLSTCESATGDIEYAEGVLGLNKAFIQAGAKTVVASLWKAHDKETANFFREVYAYLDTELNNEHTAKNNNKSYIIDYAKSIRHAKLEAIKNDKHPLYWAGFVVSG